MKERKANRFLAVLMVLAMMAGMFAGVHLNTVKAADGEAGETTSSGIELSKTATLEDDGTYTINLEAYATGETTTTTVERNVPLDIVLVLDQSGSMANDFSGSSTSTNANRRQYAMKQAVNNFIAQVADKYSEDADHRMAIVTFGSSASTLQNWTTVDASGKTSLQSAVSGLADSPSGATNVAAGMTQAQNLITSSNYTGANTERKTVVIVFTDGVPTTSSEFSTTVADSAIATAKSMKDSGVTIYTVGIFNGADPEQLYGTTLMTLLSTDTCDGSVGSAWGASTLSSIVGGDVNEVDAIAGNRFLNYLSSNFMDANEIGIEKGTAGLSGTKYTITKNFDRTSSSYYLTADTADALSSVFTSISQNVSQDSTTVTLNANSVMKDIMGDGFTLTSDSRVSIKTVAGSVDADSGEIVWGDATTNSAKAEISDDKTTVSVTGFDYADKYISSGHAGEKICVTITGVLPNMDVTTDEAVNTNAAASGIYADAYTETPAAIFPQPQTIITKKFYVLDYGKNVTLSNLDQSSVIGIVDTYKAVDKDGADNNLTQSYGKSALSNNTLTYTPTTTNWKGYDSLYVFGQTTNRDIIVLEANSNGNLWSKVSVIPANNVYYEDDFITTSTDGTTSTGTVGIVYTGDWTVVNGSLDTANNTETANGDTYGWEESLANDADYSDGSAYASGTFGATATFTFTGTGVDIYSRTDMVSGTVIVQVKSTTTNKSVTYVCDDLSTSGTYYQIPTVCFNALDYTAKNGMGCDTYTVTITVATNGSTDDKAGTEQYTYYLDGVRVYNPLGQTVTDDAYEAYEADNELNAVFTEVRDKLITAESFTADYDGAGGVVFIDDNLNATAADTETGDTATESETIEEETIEDETTEDETATETAHSTSVIGTYKSYGPENEVYLAAGQSIAFKVEGGDNYYLGLKSADGFGTKATVTDVTDSSTTKELTIEHTTDLYYEITPTSDGYIMVKNTGNNLLSISKLRSTSATSAVSGIALLSADEVDEIMVYAAGFDSLQSVASAETGVEEDSFVDTEIDTETDVDIETGDVVEDLDEDDIVIENSTENTEEEKEDSTLQSVFSNMFDTIRKWFNGRR